MRIKHIGLALKLDDPLSARDRNFIADALIDIGDWGEPAKALGLQQSRPDRIQDPELKAKQGREVCRCVTDLCLQKLISYSKAAEELANRHKFTDPFGGPDKALSHDSITSIFEQGVDKEARALLKTVISQNRVAKKAVMKK